jgi:hypothetical protein
MAKQKWQYEEVIGNRKVYARIGRSEIIVRVENVGDTTRYAEMGYPKVFGLGPSAHQATLDVRDEDIQE